jgi:hypothetical protein
MKNKFIIIYIINIKEKYQNKKIKSIKKGLKHIFIYQFLCFHNFFLIVSIKFYFQFVIKKSGDFS